MAACPTCGELNPDRARFCLNCGAALSSEGAAERSHETRRRVTVLFSDVAGSTSMGEQLDPEALREVMQRYFDAMRVAIERHEGTVEKFIGDAVMAVFGIPQLHEDDALRAVRAAFDMLAALETLNRDIKARWGVELAIRTGINTGEVVAGDATLGQALATGDVVNTAARLEQAAQAGQILVGSETYRLVRQVVTATEAEPLALKGKAELVSAWALSRLDSTVGAQVRRMDSPMVGRDRQLRILTDAAERSRLDRAPQLVTVLGLAGVGKSRLVHEFLGRVRGEATVIRGRCLSYGDAITYWPLSEALREGAGIQAEGSSEQGVQRLEQLVGDAPQASVIAQRVAGVIGLTTEDSAVPSGQETFWAIRRLFEAMAKRRPLVAVFDDVHWATPTFLDLLEHIVDWSRDAPILLLAIARPELLEARPTWGGGKLNATTLLLEPLEDAAVDEIIANLVGSRPLPGELAHRIEQAAEGNPFFVEELLSMLVDEGVLEREGDAFRVTRTPGEIAVPPTIALLLAARLDHLPTDERVTLGRASVVGKRFGAAEVAQLSPDTERETSLMRLMALVRKELVRLDEQAPELDALDEELRFRFRHQLVRDAAYEALPKHERARLHEAFADWLEEALPQRLNELYEVVGYHLEQAYLYRRDLGGRSEQTDALATRAADHLASAATRARAIGDYAAMNRLLHRATSILPTQDPQRTRLLPLFAKGLAEVGRLDEALAAVDEVLTSQEVDPVTRAEALELVELQFERGRSATEVQPMVDEALRTRRELGDENGIARALFARAALEWFRGSLDQSARTLEEALTLAQSSGDLVLEAEIRETQLPTNGISRHGGPREPTAALELIEFAREHGNILMELGATRGLAFNEGMRGNRERALALFRQTEQMSQDLGMAMPIGWGGNLAIVEEWFGNTELALANLEEHARSLQDAGERGYLSSMEAEIARFNIDLGRLEEAREAVRLADEAAAPDDVASQVEIRADRARIRAREGDLAGAEELARESIAQADRTDYINLFVIARLALADVLRLAGRRDEALQYLEEAAATEERRGGVAYSATIRRIPDSW